MIQGARRSTKPASKPGNRPRSLVAHPAHWLRFLGRDLSPALSYAAVGILLFANVINLATDIAAMDDALGFSPGR